MSVTSVGSSGSQSIGSLLLQQLLASGSGTQGTDTLTGLLGDQLNLSSTSRQLAQAPKAVTDAMSDLFSGQKDVQGDLAQLKTYFQQNPQSLVGVLASLTGGGATYGAQTALGSNRALLAAVLSGKNAGSNSGDLVSLLMGTQGEDPLLASLGDSGSGSDTSALSLFG
jgi:hypothetical protein